MKVIAKADEPKAIPEVLERGDVDIVPKIRWGDLEDVSLSLSEGFGNSSKIPNRGSVDCAEGIVKEVSNVANTGKSASSSLQVGEQTTENVKSLPASVSSSIGEESPDEKEVNVVPSYDLGSVDVELKDAPEPLNQSRDNRIMRMNEHEPDTELCINHAVNKSHPSSFIEAIESLTIDEPSDKSGDGPKDVAEISNTNENDDSQGTSLRPDLNNVVEISGDASLTETEDPKGPHYDSTYGADLGEGEQGESKERFRERLWCFLFENLNRAVDELYLLCELECDMEQIDEAILVLEEAASDFKELKSRAEHFENTKRIASQLSKDGMPMNVKADHRRPHALSWEVRVSNSSYLFFQFSS